MTDLIEIPESIKVRKKVCKCCAQEMPLDQFSRKGTSYSASCRDCLKLKEKAVKDHVKQTCAKVDAMQLGLIRQLASEPPQDFTDIPDIGTAVQHLLRPFGGMEGLALQISASYLMCEPDSTTRQRYGKMLVDAVKEASKLGYAKKPLDLMSDDELEAYADELMRRTVNDGKAEDIPELAEGA